MSFVRNKTKYKNIYHCCLYACLLTDSQSTAFRHTFSYTKKMVKVHRNQLHSCTTKNKYDHCRKKFMRLQLKIACFKEKKLNAYTCLEKHFAHVPNHAQTPQTSNVRPPLRKVVYSTFSWKRTAFFVICCFKTKPLITNSLLCQLLQVWQKYLFEEGFSFWAFLNEGPTIVINFCGMWLFHHLKIIIQINFICQFTISEFVTTRARK